MTDRRLTDHAALLLRTSMGIMFLAHGIILKYLTFTPAGTAQYFESIGYPGFTAYAVIAGEAIGGLFLLAGYKVRFVALAFIPLLVGATLQHIGNGWVFSAQDGGYEFPAFWTVALVVQALLGAGSYAVDTMDASAKQQSPALAL